MSEVQRKTIVYVPKRSRIRVYKIAKATKLCSEFKLVLVCEQQWYDPSLHDGIFDEVHFYNTHSIFKNSIFKKLIRKFTLNFGLNKMMSLIEKADPDIIHAFCEPYDHIKYIIDHTEVPIVMSDGADFTGISEGIENLSKRVRKLEKYCFENVDGIVHKGPYGEIQYYSMNGFIPKAILLSWFDHCDKDFFKENINGNHNLDTHVAYAGVISQDPKKKYINYLSLAKSLHKQKIHFHILPGLATKKDLEKYKQLDKELEYFHLHELLEYDEMIKLISKFDFGLWYHYPSGEKRAFKEKRKYAIGNKLFTYLEAGIPVLVGDHTKYGLKIVEENKIGFAVNKHTLLKLNNLLKNISYQSIKNNVIVKRDSLSLQENYNKLTEIYDQLLDA